MAEIVFVTPTMQTKISRESVGTLLLATILRQHGVDVDILQHYRFGDINDFEVFIDNAVEMICGSNPSVVSFYTRCDNYHIAIRMAERIKQRLQNVYVVFGGPHADICAEETVRSITCVDYVCCGEGETTVYPFFSSLLRGQPDTTVDGLVFRSGDTVVCNPRPKMIDNLDLIPDVDYTILGDADSDDEPDEMDGHFSIDVGRGCPFGCTYCSTKRFWGRRFRMKSPERIVNEIKNLNSRFGATSFSFKHDMFTLNHDLVREICSRLKKLDFHPTWTCSARVDCISNELIDVMVDAGLNGIYFGIETGSERMQKLVNKNLKLGEVVEKLKYIEAKGVKIVASFIFGFPDETEEDISQTIAMISDIAGIKDIKIQTHLCTFLPGTEMSDRYSAELIPVSSYSDITGADGVKECADIIEAHPALFQHFLEYRTELRTRLEYFPLFMEVWMELHHAFRYLAKRYGGRLVDMYYDFVRCNSHILKKSEFAENRTLINELIEKDKYLEMFADDERADIIRDYCRMTLMLRSADYRRRSGSAAVFCFSPGDLEGCGSLEGIARRLSVVSCSDNADGSVRMHIRSM